MKEDKLRQKVFENNWYTRQNRPKISETNSSIVEIKIELYFEYISATKIEKHVMEIFRPTDPFYFKIDCINDECLHSTLDLEPEIRNMLYEKQETRTGEKLCEGYNNYTQYLYKGNSCLATMKYFITIIYNK
ncbi:hypothetical protein [Marinoscillum luteum]|uniref:Uncharacterized protein n=1 Tax=Marinoscillum luteum TaxID=861051 RepID=A0ABW7N699_9BACT